MKFLYTLVISCCCIFFISSCNIINPSEPVPTYIHVDSFSFNGNASLGTSSHKITSVYAYLDGQSIGAFDLPITIPVIIDKKSKLQLTPVIDYNGFGGVPYVYPFYTSYVDTLTPSPGKTINIVPTTGYHSATKAALNIDFENIIPFQPYTQGIDTPIVYAYGPDQVFEGSRSGIVYLTANKDSSVNFSNQEFSAVALKETFLEINYKSTIPFTVGLFTITPKDNITHSAYIAGFYPSSKWNKVYIDLKNFTSTYSGGKFTVVLRAIKEEEHRGKDGYVLFDNIKVVTFP